MDIKTLRSKLGFKYERKEKDLDYVEKILIKNKFRVKDCAKELNITKNEFSSLVTLLIEGEKNNDI